MSKIEKYLKKSKKVLVQAWVDEELVKKVDNFNRGNKSRSFLIEALFKRLIDEEKL